MGTQGIGAWVRVGTLASGRRGRRVLAPFVVSIGLLLALAGCSSFSSSSSSSQPDPVPPPNAATSSSQSAYGGPVTARGGVTVGPPPSGAPADDSGPAGILVDVFRHNSAPSTQTAAMPPATGAMPPAQAAAMSPAPSVSTSSSVPAYAGPTSGRGGVTAGPPPSSQPADDSGPSGLLVNLFRSNSTPSAAPSNKPHPPSTYTASAPPYAPPPGQPGAAPAPSSNSAQ